MTVAELVQKLLAVKNQNKEVYTREIVKSIDSYYSVPKPVDDFKEYDDKVVIK